MSDFALIGAAGFVAPRHLKAIKDTGNTLVAALDKSDAAGILDQYFPQTSFFTEFERFDRHLEKLRRSAKGIDYISICSPNYLHDAHIRFGLRHGANVICEKPLVLNPWNVDALQKLQEETGRKVFNILQLRLHPSLLALKQKVESAGDSVLYDIDLTYITCRGKWYFAGWKGDLHKSGGIATNIGIHFFDMLLWIFGPAENSVVHVHSHDRAAGFLQLRRAKVRWFLSISEDTMPRDMHAQGKRVYRSIKINSDEIDLSDGFNDLHTDSYKEILKGNGLPLEAAIPSLHLVHRIRNEAPVAMKEDYHPLAKLPLSNHPFER